MNNTFFKPTKRYKIYRILNEIQEKETLTQRDLSQTLGIAVSMVNQYLDELEEEGLIKRKRNTRKDVKYLILPKGMQLKDILSVEYLSATQKVYDIASAFILNALTQMAHSGIKDLLFYGAGEVAEIILSTYQKSAISQTFRVHAIIDDDVKRQNQVFLNIPVISFEEMNDYPYDAIFIASFTHQARMENTLKNKGIPNEKIKKIFHA